MKKTRKINPIDKIKDFWPNANIDHLTFDPNLKKEQYLLTTEHVHDGTLIFTKQLLQKVLLMLVNSYSFYEATDPEILTKIKSTNYTLGYLTLEAEPANLKIGDGKYDTREGLRERLKLPVKCDYVLKD